MKATEQLSSLEMMAVDPLRRVISPRFWGGVIAMPILAILFTAVGIIGGSLVGVDWKGIDDGSFWSVMQNAVTTQDLLYGFIKAAVLPLQLFGLLYLMVMIVFLLLRGSVWQLLKQLCILH